MTEDVVKIKGSATLAAAILRKSDFVEKPKEKVLAEEIESAIAQARQTCEIKGRTSPECAVAWDVVEERQAEAAHQKAEKMEKLSRG